jgi:thiol-disulfide isomerase/thioredoxin
MKKPIIISGSLVAITIGVLVALGVFSKDPTTQSNATKTNETVNTQQPIDTTTTQEPEAEQKVAADPQPSPATTTASPAKAEDPYITLADYNANKSAYSDYTKVLFFHAPWCPICKSIDKAITEDASKIPAKTVFIKTDYDSNTSLRQQYGVTYQYTFVSIDNSGRELKQWSATSYDKAVAGI